jgi:hypothetical protein
MFLNITTNYSTQINVLPLNSRFSSFTKGLFLKGNACVENIFVSSLQLFKINVKLKNKLLNKYLIFKSFKRNVPFRLLWTPGKTKLLVYRMSHCLKYCFLYFLPKSPCSNSNGVTHFPKKVTYLKKILCVS